jgi:hypothetical protein
VRRLIRTGPPAPIETAFSRLVEPDGEDNVQNVVSPVPQQCPTLNVQVARTSVPSVDRFTINFFFRDCPQRRLEPTHPGAFRDRGWSLSRRGVSFSEGSSPAVCAVSRACAASNSDAEGARRVSPCVRETRAAAYQIQRSGLSRRPGVCYGDSGQSVRRNASILVFRSSAEMLKEPVPRQL